MYRREEKNKQVPEIKIIEYTKNGVQFFLLTLYPLSDKGRRFATLLVMKTKYSTSKKKV